LHGLKKLILWDFRDINILIIFYVKLGEVVERLKPSEKFHGY